MEKVVIFGTSGAAVLSHFDLTHDSPYEVAAFTVDRAFLKEDRFRGLPVVPFEDVTSLYPPSSHKMFVSLFASRVNKTRAEKYEQAKAKGYSLINYVSSRAVLAPGYEIGDNCYIGDGVIARPFLKLGNDVFVLPGAYLGHDADIKDHCFIAARATILGEVTLEPFACLGSNATVLDRVTIGRSCVVGAGSVISESAPDRAVFRVAPPAKLPLGSDKLENILFQRRG